MAECVDNPLETFRQGQESILASLEQVSSSARTYPSCRSMLSELEAKIFAHMQFQSKREFLDLEKFVRGQCDAEAKIKFLQYDVREFKIKALTFFDTYLNPASAVATRNFPIAFAEFRRTVIERIHTEEEHLLPLLEDFWRRREKAPETGELKPES